MTIPCATAGATRAFRYEVEAKFRDAAGQSITLTEKAYDAKYNMPLEMSGAPTKYLVKSGHKSADGKVKITVTPLDCFDNRGEPLTT